MEPKNYNYKDFLQKELRRCLQGQREEDDEEVGNSRAGTDEVEAPE